MGRSGQKVLKDEDALGDRVSVGLLARAFPRATVEAVIEAAGGAEAADTDAAVVAGRVLRTGVGAVHGHGWRPGDAQAGWDTLVGGAGGHGGVAVGGGA